MIPRTAFCVLLILLGVSAMIAPVLHYLIYGWEAKRRDIMDGLGADARLQYFRMFRRVGAQPTQAADASTKFELLYTEWYGRKFFCFPTILFCCSSVISVALVIFTVLHGRGFMDNPLFNIPEPAIAALAGAYMWVVNWISRHRIFNGPIYGW